MGKTKTFAAITYVAMIVINALANLLPINGTTTGDISNSYPNLFAPAAATFSIWGIIYLLLAGHVLYLLGIFRDKNADESKLPDDVSKYFIVSSLANCAWIFSWHYRLIGISVLLMIVILWSLIKIADLVNHSQLSSRENLLIRAPFSIYFGWITVATIANITTFLVSAGWKGFGIEESVWTVIILMIGATIGVVRMLKDRNALYGLVLIWAYMGIWLKHTSASGFNSQYTNVLTTLIVCVAMFVLTEAVIMFRVKKRALH